MTIAGQTPEKLNKTITTVLFSIIISLVIFSVLAWYIIDAGIVDVDSEREHEELFLLLTPAVTVIFALLGNWLFKRTINNISPSEELEHRMHKVRKAYTIEYGLIEFAAIFPIIITIVEAHYIYLVLTGFMVALLLFKKPTVQKIKEYLKV